MQSVSQLSCQSAPKHAFVDTSTACPACDPLAGHSGEGPPGPGDLRHASNLHVVPPGNPRSCSHVACTIDCITVPQVHTSAVSAHSRRFYVSLAFQLRRHNPDRGQAFMLRVTAHMPFSSTPSLTSPRGANVTPLSGRSLRGGRDANGHADNSKSGVEALVPSGALASPVLCRFVRGWRVGADIPITLVGVNAVSAYIPPHRNSHRSGVQSMAQQSLRHVYTCSHRSHTWSTPHQY